MGKAKYSLTSESDFVPMKTALCFQFVVVIAVLFYHEWTGLACDCGDPLRVFLGSKIISDPRDSSRQCQRPEVLIPAGSLPRLDSEIWK